MEDLNNMIKTINMNGWLRGFDVARIGERNLWITHLQYANDNLLLCDAEEDQLWTLRVILVLLKGFLGCTSIGGKVFLYPINEEQNMEILNQSKAGNWGIYPPSI